MTEAGMARENVAQIDLRENGSLKNL